MKVDLGLCLIGYVFALVGMYFSFYWKRQAKREIWFRSEDDSKRYRVDLSHYVLRIEEYKYMSKGVLNYLRSYCEEEND